MESHRRFGVTWRSFRDGLGARSFMVSLIFESSRKESRDRPVVSDTTLIGRNDSPLLVGPDEQKGEK